MLGLSNRGGSANSSQKADQSSGKIFKTVSEWRLYKYRHRLAAIATLVSSTILIATLAGIANSNDWLPWFITVGAISLFAGARLLTEQKNFVLDENVAAFSMFEALALVYSLQVCLFLGILQLKLNFKLPDHANTLQIIDIELNSLNDLVDKKIDLPSTQEAESLHKLHSDQITNQGVLPNTPRQQPEQKAQEKPKPIEQKTSSAINNIAAPQSGATKDTSRQLAMNSHWSTYLVAPSVQPNRKKVANNNNSAPYLEEVPPPEMVELMENDGDESTALFQNGGNSTAGTGSKHELTAYLKEIHKRIKNSWSPPRGLSHRAEVLFRIKPDGHLAFIKLAHSSGDPQIDNSSIQAVASAFPYKALPASFTAPYLDLLYKFNYTSDELKEVPNQ